jgi:hypothetical protein
MYCSNCSTKLPEGAKFCAECGTAAPKQASPSQRPSIAVDQHVATNEGQVIGLNVGKGPLQGGLSADINQGIGEVKQGGAVVGAIVGAEGPVHVGGQQNYGDTISIRDMSGDGGVIGRGQATVNKGIGGSDLAALFAPLLQAAQSVSSEKREQAVQEMARLQAEVAKGKGADDHMVAGLIESLVGLAPAAVSAVVSAFGSPLLAGIAGPATTYVLKKLGLKE